MGRLTVVGSGPSAVHLALTAVLRGAEVTLLDVGRERPEPVRPDDGFEELKEHLDDPAAYFLGPRFEGVLFPGAAGEYYGFPPHKSYIFQGLAQFPLRSRGFQPLASFGQGGLAEAWTGGVFPFNEAELADFPFPWAEIAPYYGLVARRIGVSGVDDDLARFVPVHEHLSEPLDLDEHSCQLLASYGREREWLNSRLRCFLGRSRVAVLRDDEGERLGCTYLGRCLWGCPRESLYTPLLTLRRLARMSGFTYVPRTFVSHFESDGAGRVTRVVAESTETGARAEFPVDQLALAAGTLSTSRIFMESIRRAGGTSPVLSGLMDNRQALVPYVNLAMLRRPWRADTYQYHQLALGLEGERPEEYVHGLVTTLKTALIHPLVQSVPMDLARSLALFRDVHAALGLVNVNLHDRRREGNTLALEEDPGGGPARLLVSYAPASDEPRRLRRALRTVRRALRRLGCLVPPGMTHVRPMGASVHYAGTLPMGAEKRPLTTSPEGRSHDFENLWIADASTFPFLPAKNLTFTLMANAARVAERAIAALS